MPLVTVTGNAWDASRAPIPALNEPELWFRPLDTEIGSGLLTDREVPAKTFDVASGAFTVDVESKPGLLYQPIMRWLKNAEDPRNRARTETEWLPFFPDLGGDIDDLIEIAIGIGLVYVDSSVQLGMSPIPRYQLAYNPVTNDLYERVLEW